MLLKTFFMIAILRRGVDSRSEVLERQGSNILALKTRTVVKVGSSLLQTMRIENLVRTQSVSDV